jgi:ribosome-binding factor A
MNRAKGKRKAPLCDIGAQSAISLADEGGSAFERGMPKPVTRPSAAAPSQRMLRVAEVIRHAMADVLSRGDVEDPALGGKVITVPEVRMSPDLKIATIYVMPLGGKEVDLVVKALAKQAKPIRHALAGRLREMKSLPDLRFRADESFDEATRIDALLATDRVKRDLG